MTQNNDLVCALDDGRARLRDLAAELGPEHEVYPGWTVKHLIAHITGWDDAVLASLRSYLAGVVPPTPATRGFDLYNEGTVGKRLDLSYGVVLEQWEQTRQELKDLVNSLPEERLSEELLLPWGPTGTIYALVMEMALHEKDHVLEIQDSNQKADREA